MDETARIVFVGFAAPAAVGLVGGLLTLGPARPPGASKLSPAEMLAWMDKPARTGLLAGMGGTLTLVIGDLVSQYGIHGSVMWPQVSVQDRLRVLLVVLAVLGVLAAVVMKFMSGRGLLVWALLLGAASAAVVLWPRLQPGSSGQTLPKVLAVAGFAAFVAAAAWPLNAMVRRGQRITSAVILTGLGAAVGAAQTGTDSMVLGQFAFGVAAICLGMLIAVVSRRGAAIDGAAAVVATSLLGGLAAAGHYFSDLPAWLAAGLACVPLAGWAVGAIIGTRLRPALRATVQIVVAAALAGACVAPGISSLANWQKQTDPNDPYSGYGSKP